MIILIDAEEAFDKFQHPFIIKIIIKLGIEENLFKLTKCIYTKFILLYFIKFIIKIYNTVLMMKHEILSP